MKSKVQFILSMVIFGAIGLVVRFIDLSSSERALLSSFIGCLFLTCILFMMKKKIVWHLVKSNALILVFSAIALGGFINPTIIQQLQMRHLVITLHQ
jgi:hypothetical protein